MFLTPTFLPYPIDPGLPLDSVPCLTIYCATSVWTLNLPRDLDFVADWFLTAIAMGDRCRRPRSLCVNCNICMNTLQRFRVLEQNTRVITLLHTWTHPLIITEDDFVCQACYDLAMRSVNQSLHQQVSSDCQGSSTHRGHTDVCLICGCSTARRQRHRILTDNIMEFQQSMIDIIAVRVAPRQINIFDHVCHACWMRVQREARRNALVDARRPEESETPFIEGIPAQPTTPEQPTIPAQPTIPEQPTTPESVSLNTSISTQTAHTTASQLEDSTVQRENHILLPEYRRAANSNNRCVFPDCNVHPLRTISDKLRALVVINHKYYMPKLARLCDYHRNNNMWDTLFNSTNSIESFSAEDVQHLFSFIKTSTGKVDFENLADMDDNIFYYWIGLTKEQFNFILAEVPQLIQLKRGTLGLTAYLLKMRTGDSDERISTLMEVPRRTLEVLMNKVRNILSEHFVPNNLGVAHITRQEIINKNLILPNGLYGHNNNAVVICDGTYLYINKSANYSFQKKSYSLHKYRNLLKLFLIVATDGYIIDCFGLYKATTSDSEIMNNLLRDGSALRSYFESDDVFILDRGFRDSMSFLEGCGYRPHMPESLLEGEYQLTTEQANRSRCVTICRWVVEAVNGHFKRNFKLFRQENVHRSLPHLMENLKIAAALLNRFGVRFRDNTHANEMLSIIRQKINLDNNLSNMVQIINLNRRSSSFQNITANADNLDCFPTMEYRDLILFALGTYQIRQARSYYGEHVRSHGGCNIEICRDGIIPSEYGLRGSGETSLIRGKIKSRHVSRKIYYVYILIQNHIPGRSGILEYCCNCLVGRRTVGCCAHVMTLVWYLGWARHQDSISPPAEVLDYILSEDNT